MGLDRNLQRSILERFAKCYPCPSTMGSWDEDLDDVRTNMYYLKEHGLLEVHGSIGQHGTYISEVVITAAGMDFLADDGGLSTILGVVTIKLHDETIRDLIAARIQNSNLPAAEKTGLLDQLRELRGESIKHLTMKLLDAGLENWPTALAAIQKFL